MRLPSSGSYFSWKNFIGQKYSDMLPLKQDFRDYKDYRIMI